MSLSRKETKQVTSKPSLVDRWKQYKRKKRLRAEKRQTFFTERPYYKIGFRVGIVSIITVTAGVSLYVARQMMLDYRNTSKWTKISGPELASLDADLLYLSAAQKKLRTDYTTQKEKVWNGEQQLLTSNATKEQMSQLTSMYESLDDKSKFEKEYNEIITYYSIQESIADLFTDSDQTTLKESVTATGLSTQVQEMFSQLSPYLTQLTVSKQATILQNKLYSLAEDSIVLSQIVSQFQSAFNVTVDGTKIKGTTNLSTQKEKELRKLLTSIPHSKWEFVTKVLQPLLSEAKESVEVNQKVATAEANYKEEQERKSSFEVFLARYKEEEGRLNQNVIELPDFTKMTVVEAEEKAKEVGITLRKIFVTSSESDGTILSQTPSTSLYNRTLKGVVIELTIARSPLPFSSTYTPSSSSSSSTSTSTSSSTITSSSR